MNTLIRGPLSIMKNSTSITVFTRKGEIGKIDELMIKDTNKKWQKPTVLTTSCPKWQSLVRKSINQKGNSRHTRGWNWGQRVETRTDEVKRALYKAQQDAERILFSWPPHLRFRSPHIASRANFQVLCHVKLVTPYPSKGLWMHSAHSVESKLPSALPCEVSDYCTPHIASRANS